MSGRSTAPLSPLEPGCPACDQMSAWRAQHPQLVAGTPAMFPIFPDSWRRHAHLVIDAAAAGRRTLWGGAPEAGQRTDENLLGTIDVLQSKGGQPDMLAACLAEAERRGLTGATVP